MSFVLPYLDPIAISLFGLDIHYYGLAYLLAFVLGGLGIKYYGRKINLSEQHVSDIVFYAVLGVIIGGRLGYCLFYQLEHIFTNPFWIFKIWEGGMSFHGGLIGVTTSVWWISKKQERCFWEVSDVLAIVAPIGLFFGRIANFINQELWGRATDVSWAVVFTKDTLAIARHPSQLYEAILEGLVLYLTLHIIYQYSRRAGITSISFGILYAIMRFGVEFTRAPDAHLGLLWGVLSRGQILSLIMALIFMLLYYYKFKRVK